MLSRFRDCLANAEPLRSIKSLLEELQTADGHYKYILLFSDGHYKEVALSHSIFSRGPNDSPLSPYTLPYLPFLFPYSKLQRSRELRARVQVAGVLLLRDRHLLSSIFIVIVIVIVFFSDLILIPSI
ncbi:hypothetical protein L1987_33790 [Smallanthus sonchifolius]|uniref:Uncharacterized protein n=1 Tax=Smallanthus sonchifolius TaxID=185202 RepID=A0ACB9HT81_9ASTR|nr:hypothetical protein L1987_33790 [Smallanthus sonchifolius]